METILKHAVRLLAIPNMVKRCGFALSNEIANAYFIRAFAIPIYCALPNFLMDYEANMSSIK